MVHIQELESGNFQITVIIESDNCKITFEGIFSRVDNAPAADPKEGGLNLIIK